MNIYELLKQLNKIEPDKNYSLISKNKILGESLEQKNVFIKPVFKFGFLRQLTFSAVFGLALLFIILAMSSLFKNFYPNFSALNAGAIKAEADAIDFQIQLSKVVYNMPPKESLDKLISNVSKDIKKEQKETSFATSSSISTSSTSTAVSFTPEEVLDYLSK